jgi:DprA winged helix domain
VPREDTEPVSAEGAEQAAGQQAAQQQAAETPSALTDQERTLLDILKASTTARTTAQLAADSGLPRDQVASMLESLRVKGLVTLFNTVIESYGARFPDLEMR